MWVVYSTRRGHDVSKMDSTGLYEVSSELRQVYIGRRSAQVIARRILEGSMERIKRQERLQNACWV